MFHRESLNGRCRVKTLIDNEIKKCVWNLLKCIVQKIFHSETNDVYWREQIQYFSVCGYTLHTLCCFLLHDNPYLLGISAKSSDINANYNLWKYLDAKVNQHSISNKTWRTWREYYHRVGKKFSAVIVTSWKAFLIGLNS